jgi:5-methylthioribose kinase
MGFDIGAFIGNLLLAYSSKQGHTTSTSSSNSDDSTTSTTTEQYSEYILQQIEQFHTNFEQQFVALWSDSATNSGDAYPRCHFDTDTAALQRVQSVYMRRLLHDSIGFAGAKVTNTLLLYKQLHFLQLQIKALASCFTTANVSICSHA